MKLLNQSVMRDLNKNHKYLMFNCQLKHSCDKAMMPITHSSLLFIILFCSGTIIDGQNIARCCFKDFFQWKFQRIVKETSKVFQACFMGVSTILY